MCRVATSRGGGRSGRSHLKGSQEMPRVPVGDPEHVKATLSRKTGSRPCMLWLVTSIAREVSEVSLSSFGHFFLNFEFEI